MGISKLPISTTNNPSIYSKVIAEGTISSSPNTKTISIPAGSYIGYSSTSNPVVFNGGAITNTFLGSADGVKSVTTSSISTLNTYILPGANIRNIPVNLAGIASNIYGISIASNGQNVISVVTTDIGVYVYRSGNSGDSWSQQSLLSSVNNSQARSVVVYDPVFSKFLVYVVSASFGATFLAYSDDSSGSTWSNTSGIITSVPLSAATNGSGVFVGVQNSTNITISTTGTSFTTATVPTNFAKIFAANGVFFASTLASSLLNFYTSTNGTTWTARTLPNTNDDFIGVVYSQGTYIVYTSGGYYFTSTDLSTWSIAKDGYVVGQNRPGVVGTTAQAPTNILSVNGALFSILGSRQAGYNTITNVVSAGKPVNIESVSSSAQLMTGIRSGIPIEITNQAQYARFPTSYTSYPTAIYDSSTNIIHTVVTSGLFAGFTKISADTSTGASIYGTITTAF